jgi:predicted alpha/beta hydrolase family esterase
LPIVAPILTIMANMAASPMVQTHIPVATGKVGTPICLIVPGLDNSGPDHWQSLWEIIRDDCRRVDLGCWSRPERGVWIDRLDRDIHASTARVVLVAHSLGCLAVAWWAAEADPRLLARVEGALLVAPPDVDRPGAHPAVASFRPAPRRPLPFRSILVASRDDPYASFESLAALAKDWGSRLVDVGRCGHINTDSDLALWPEGEALLDELIGDRRSSD